MLKNEPLDPRKDSLTKDPKEIVNTPSDEGTKKTEDGILSNLDFWQNRYSDTTTKYEQISLVDAMQTAQEVTPIVFDDTKEYVQTAFEGFEPVEKPKRKKRKTSPDDIESICDDIQNIISHYDDSAKPPKEETKAKSKAQREDSPAPKAEITPKEEPEKAEETKKDEVPEKVIPSADSSADEEIKEDIFLKEEIEEPKEKEPEKAEEKNVPGEETSLDFSQETKEEAVFEKKDEEVISENSQNIEDTFINPQEEKQIEEKDPQQPLTLLNTQQSEDEEISDEEISQSEPEKESKPQKKEPEVISEYSDPSQKDFILKGLKASLSRTQFVKTAVAITFILSAAVTSIPLILNLLRLDVSSFEPVGHIILSVINIILLILAVSFSSQSFISGFLSLKRGITAHTVSSFAAILALVQSVVNIFSTGDSPVISYSYISVAIFSILLNSWAEEKNIKRIITCFNFCAFTQSDALYSIRTIEGREDAADIGRDLNMEDPKILYSGRIEFATDFLRNCKSSGVSSEIIKKNLIISIVMSIIITGLSVTLTKDFFAALSTFTGTFCLTSPLGVLFSLASSLLSANTALAKDGGTILSYPAAQRCAQADAVAVDCADLLCRSHCEIKGVRGLGAVRYDDVLLFAVAMVLQSGGPLSEAFNEVIEGQREILPKVRRLRYIDKLGLNAKIYNHEIFLGTRELMFKNGININFSSDERKYLQNGYKILYMCVDSVFAGYFILKYEQDKTLNDPINEIDNKGVKFIMRTDDPNVTNEYIIKCFKLSPDSVKSTVDIGSAALRWYRNSLVPTDTAGVLHDGNPYSYFMTIAICHRLRNFVQSFKTFALIFSLLFAAAATAAVITGTWILLSPFTIIAIHAIAIFITFIAQKIKI